MSGCKSCGCKTIENKEQKLEKTEIDFCQTMDDGIVRVVAIRNVSSMTEIRVVFGKRVMTDYQDQKPRYYRDGDGALRVVDEDGKESNRIMAGTVIETWMFDEIIDTMKAACDRLKECREHAAKNPVKTVII